MLNIIFSIVCVCAYLLLYPLITISGIGALVVFMLSTVFSLLVQTISYVIEDYVKNKYRKLYGF